MMFNAIYYSNSSNQSIKDGAVKADDQLEGCW
jgi:hypothetical protein